MKQAETERVMISLKRTLPLMAVVLVVFAAGARAQTSLGDLVAEGGYHWIMGRWVGTTDEGDKMLLEYKWELNKYLLTVHLKWPEYEYRGMIFYDAPKDQVIQVGVDAQGGNGKGLWEPMGDKALLKYEHTGANWETNRMALAHSRVDADTMKIEVHELYSSGEVADTPSGTVEFKRVKEKPAKKAKSKA